MKNKNPLPFDFGGLHQHTALTQPVPSLAIPNGLRPLEVHVQKSS